jgi:Fe-S-cluster containining protein
MLDPDAYPFEFTCQRSGNCCAIPSGVVRVSVGDVEALAAHLGLSVAAVRSRFVAPSGDRLKDGLGTRCVFLAEGRRGATCTVYPVRPERCRTWPYWPELIGAGERLAAAMRLCPGIRRRP